jgi:hypothetical protein
MKIPGENAFFPRKMWYVYVLAYPDDTIFYIGKGTINAREDIRCRMNDHGSE